MQMNTSRRSRWTLSGVLLTALATVALTAAGYGQATQLESVDHWATTVWRSAERGDMQTLERYLGGPPENVKSEHVSRLVQSLEQREANASRVAEEIAAKRAESLEKLEEFIDEGNILKALHEAVTFQSFSENYSEILRKANVRQLIADSDRYARQVEEEGDWLYARELLYRLRTLHEDTDRFDRYDHFDRRLKIVTRRVSLLAYYAPRRLHELRNNMAIRLGEEPLKPFNEAMAADWEERIENIRHTMVTDSIRRAAQHHIEGAGWEPLIEGGLQAMLLLVTTSDLAETFTELNNERYVEQWKRFIRDQLNQGDSRRTPSGHARLRDVIDGLLHLNEQTFKLDDRVLLREFGDGAMYRFDDMYDDPYTEIIWPNQLRRFRQATQGQFIGVGILISHDERREIRVVTPLEGSPAYFAGVKPDDRIVEVNGRSTAGWSLNDAVDNITGRKGTLVTLGIRREGEDEVVEIPIVRDVIKMYSVRGWEKTGLSEDGVPQWDWYIDPASRIAYIRLSEFNQETARDLVKSWNELSNNGRDLPNGLILDLRFNPGGLLDAAVDVSRLFLDGGPIVSGEDGRQRRNFLYDAEGGTATIGRHRIPTVVLINKGSASASEIVAGALQAHGAAVVIGERSHGKGSVQTVHPISPEAALKVTSQYYRLPGSQTDPNGRLVHRRPGARVWGVDPNVEVRMTEEQVRLAIEIRRQADVVPGLVPVDLPEADGDDTPDEEQRDINDLLAKGVDTQLEMALVVLQARALPNLVGDMRHARSE